MPKRQPSQYVLQRLAETAAERELKRRMVAGHKHVVREVSRHGTPSYFYRKGKGRRVRLPDPNSVSPTVFNQAYAAAAEGRGPPSSPGRTPPPPLMKPGKAGYTYFLRSGDMVKIGFSNSPWKRLRTLQTGIADDAVLLSVIPSTEQTERYFHAHFRAYHQRGEWFRLEGRLAAFLVDAPNLPAPIGA